MGALAPVMSWIPKDDLLLKNAIEAGASLESLAKGAVQFSRRFTIKELQDRWNALLYDPNIATEASVRMAEFERSQSTLPSKSSKAENLKETKHCHGKRKAESVRSCYYAIRKRIRNQPLDQGDLNFLVAPGDGCFISGAEGPSTGSILGDPMASPFGLEDANFDDLHHVFPQPMRDPMGQQNILEGPIQQDMAMAGNCTGTTQMGLLKDFPAHGTFAVNGIQANPECNGKNIMCSGVVGNTIFSAPISECENSFHHLQYGSSPPGIPDWKSIEDISVPEMPGDVTIKGNNVQTGDPFSIPVDGGSGNGTSEYDVIRTEPELNNHMSCADLKNSTGCSEGYFAELSDSLFNFTSEDEMLIIDGGKDMIDKSYFDGLSSLLLNSPDNDNEDEMPDILEMNEPTPASIFHNLPTSTGPEEKDAGDTQLGNTDLHSSSDTHMLMCASSIDSQFPEYRDGVFSCTLNTEDPDIPCNDDVVFPSKPRAPSAHRRTQSEGNNPSLPSKDNTVTQVSGIGLSAIKREPKRIGGSHPASQTQGRDVGLKCAVDEFGVEFDASRNFSTVHGGVPQIGKPGHIISEKHGQTADLSHVQPGIVGFNQEAKTSLTVRNQEFYANQMTVEAGGGPLLSDPEEQFSESDTDIPYFSDIESMILDMDLGPEDQDYFSSIEVAKYQHEDAKRAIIRLEQSAHSFMQRAIASRGAFAVLCGRHSKHYIKKPEVLLGRATDDVVVDIDLGREGRANKISRRQALLKMEKDGTFNLRNMGRCSIFVNSMEIFPGQSLGLHSNCLIEIRGMPFIFETHQARVKQYLAKAARKYEAKGRTL